MIYAFEDYEFGLARYELRYAVNSSRAGRRCSMSWPISFGTATVSSARKNSSISSTKH
jgi:hypothetical protein